MSAWNPIDGWVSSKPSKMEVLARVGPITIDDYLIVSDSVSNNYSDYKVRLGLNKNNHNIQTKFSRSIQNETKNFNVRLAYAGIKSCVALNWGDETPNEYWGNIDSCRLRFPDLVESSVGYFDTFTKEFQPVHIFE